MVTLDIVGAVVLLTDCCVMLLVQYGRRNLVSQFNVMFYSFSRTTAVKYGISQATSMQFSELWKGK
jgi:hypothetical protein